MRDVIRKVGPFGEFVRQKFDLSVIGSTEAAFPEVEGDLADEGGVRLWTPDQFDIGFEDVEKSSVFNEDVREIVQVRFDHSISNHHDTSDLYDLFDKAVRYNVEKDGVVEPSDTSELVDVPFKFVKHKKYGWFMFGPYEEANFNQMIEDESIARVENYTFTIDLSEPDTEQGSDKFGRPLRFFAFDENGEFEAYSNHEWTHEFYDNCDTVVPMRMPNPSNVFGE